MQAERVFFLAWRYRTNGFWWFGLDVWPFRLGIHLWDDGKQQAKLMIIDWRIKSERRYRTLKRWESHCTDR